MIHEALPRRELVVLVYGDSISAAAGVPDTKGWVSLLARRLKRRLACAVHNRSQSGRTSEEGVRDLERTLKEVRPDVVVIQLGANDAFAGAPVSTVRENLTRMVALAASQGSEAIVAGVNLPPAIEQGYARRFLRMHYELAKQVPARVVPSLLRKVGTDPTMMQLDGRHPNARGHTALLANIAPKLEAVLSRLQHGDRPGGP